jgi:transcriptional regulator with XRE-family HTH domain
LQGSPTVRLSPEQAVAARKLVGWSQADLAYIVGVRELAVRRFESRERHSWNATVAAFRMAFEEVGVEFLGELGVMPKLKDSTYRSTIVGEGNGSGAMHFRKEFRSFRSAVHYYVLRLSPEEREICYIVTADGSRWRRSELLLFFKQGQKPQRSADA